MGLFRKLLKPKIGIIHVTPYISWGNIDDLSEEQKAVTKRIAAKLYKYQDKMVEYGNKRDSWQIDHGNGIIISYGFVPLQQVSADWDVDNDTLDLLAVGSGAFRWKGSVEQFLGQSDAMKLEQLT